MKVYGLIGEKLGHSLSPAIHKSIYRHLGMDGSYSLFQVKPEELSTAVQGIKALGINGVNVTIPYKVRIIEHVDRLSTEAAKIGAINTIAYEGGYLIGFNTDYIGFERMLEKYQLNVQGKTAVVLGSGGASKSVIAYLVTAGIDRIYVVSRNVESVELKEKHRAITYEQAEELGSLDLLINCTPVGMYPNVDASPVKETIVSRAKTVVDLVYNPTKTKLMQQASDLGIPSYNGLYMLVAQAVAAVEIWNKIQISEEVVSRIYNELIDIIND